MSRVQLALNVTDLDAAIDFYSKLFATAPNKIKPGYANFAVADPPLKLVLFEAPDGPGATLNHLGVEVEDTAQVSAATARLSGEGLDTKVEEDSTCCFATQDKVWVSDPDGARWEVYVVKADSDTFGGAPAVQIPASEGTVVAAAVASAPTDGPICCG